MIELKLKKEKILKVLLGEKTAIILDYKLKESLIYLSDNSKVYCSVKLADPYLMSLSQINRQINVHLLTEEEVEGFEKDKLYFYKISKVKLLKVKFNCKMVIKKKKKTVVNRNIQNDSLESAETVLGIKKHILRVIRHKAIYMDIMKPYPNEHSARIRTPEDFKKESFRSHQLKKGLRRITARLKSNNKWETQAYRFHVDYYTVVKAKEWLKEHEIKYISFEPSSSK